MGGARPPGHLLGAAPAHGDGCRELDSFEYHPDNPDLLELTNHVTSGSDYYTDSGAIAPGQWVTIGTRYGADSVDWYVNGKKVYSDGHGVGNDFSAYLILNLSLSAGEYHPAPSGSTPIKCRPSIVCTASSRFPSSALPQA